MTNMSAAIKPTTTKNKTPTHLALCHFDMRHLRRTLTYLHQPQIALPL